MSMSQMKNIFNDNIPTDVKHSYPEAFRLQTPAGTLIEPGSKPEPHQLLPSITTTCIISSFPTSVSVEPVHSTPLSHYNQSFILCDMVTSLLRDRGVWRGCSACHMLNVCRRITEVG